MAGNTGQILRRRIRGIRETAKVTGAMELIAGARMRRAEQNALNARPYAARLHDLMMLTLSQSGIGMDHPYLARSDQGPVLVVHITTDKGLCGGLNLRLNQTLGQFIVSQQAPVRVATVGKKGRDFAVRMGLGLVADFSELGDSPGVSALRPLCRLITDSFTKYEVDRVYLCYPRFVSVVVHRPVVEQILPVEIWDSKGAAAGDVVFEPEPQQVLEQLLMRYVEASVYHAHLELVASEYSARMVAMHSATESAHEMAEAITIDLNRSRQAAVTEEICDVIAGAELVMFGGGYE
jgi:F-type H+-transporting ATPase subunit gamma